MDPEIKKELERQTLEKVELVKKEMAWEEEKYRIALEKLRSRSVKSNLSAYGIIHIVLY